MSGEESNVILFDPDPVTVLDRHVDDDRTSSCVIDPADWAERGLLQRAGEALTKTVSGGL